MEPCLCCVRAIVIIVQFSLAVSTLAVAAIASGHIDYWKSYNQYFVGSGDDYDEVRDSDRLHRLALILSISSYWVYIAVVITAAIGLGVESRYSSSKCLSATWLLTALMLLVSVFAVSVSIASLVFTVNATNSFNTVAPRVMIDSLRHNGVNVSLTEVTQMSSSRAIEENNTGVLWDTLQYQRRCCGYQGVDDYISGSWKSSNENRSEAVAPLTCCRQFTRSSCLYNGTNRRDYYVEGCFSVLSSSTADDEELVILLSSFIISLVVINILFVVIDSRMKDEDDD